MDREKVIKDLEEYRDREFVKEGITVFDNDPRYRKLIIGNALALLKEQDAVVRCKYCIHADDFDCPAPLPTGYLCQKGHGSHMGDWFCADGEDRG